MIGKSNSGHSVLTALIILVCLNFPANAQEKTPNGTDPTEIRSQVDSRTYLSVRYLF